MHWLEFLKQFLTRNREIGAVAESSDGLAELITEYASVETADVVLEPVSYTHLTLPTKA